MIVTPILEKTRYINKILQNTDGQYVDFKEIAEVLKNVIQANIYIVDLKGVILGFSVVDSFECEIMINQVLNKGYFPQRYNEFLLRNDEYRDNLKQKSNRCIFLEGADCLFANKIVTVIPVIGGRDRLGTLLLARYGELFKDEDMILAERGATVVGMEILRAKAEKIEEEARTRAIVKLSLDTLSYSEQEAVERIFKELDNQKEGFLVASKIADQMSITRSVIVNALRKLECAGIIESRSLGMKGTHIKVINPYLYESLGKTAASYFERR